MGQRNGWIASPTLSPQFVTSRTSSPVVGVVDGARQPIPTGGTSDADHEELPLVVDESCNLPNEETRR